MKKTFIAAAVLICAMLAGCGMAATKQQVQASQVLKQRRIIT